VAAGQPVKTGHPRVANSPSPIAVAGRVSTLPGPSGQPRSSTNRKGDPKADRRALGIGVGMGRSISPPQENASCQEPAEGVTGARQGSHQIRVRIGSTESNSAPEGRLIHCRFRELMAF
jgi:hypothetical protein